MPFPGWLRFALRRAYPPKPSLLNADSPPPGGSAFLYYRMSAYTRFLRALRSRVLTAMALILIALSSGPASATMFYWDVDGSDSGNTTGGANLGGTGTWDALASNWWDGLNPLNSWLNSPDDSAVFTYAYPALGIPSNFGVTVAGGRGHHRRDFVSSQRLHAQWGSHHLGW